MTLAQDLKTRGKHRGLTPWQLVQKIGRLERDVRKLQQEADKVTPMAARLDEQAMAIDSLRGQLDIAKSIKDTVNAKAERFDEAESRADTAEQMLAGQTAELYELRAFRDNATAVTLPPAERDTSEVEDQATAPEGIDVRPIWEAAAAGLLGPVVQVSVSGASADPGHVRQTGWGVDDTQPLTTVEEVA